MKTHKHREDELDKAQHEPNKVNENNQAALLGCVYVLHVCTYADLCKFEWQFINDKLCILRCFSCRPQLFLILTTMTTESFISTELVDHRLLFVLLTPSPGAI